MQTSYPEQTLSLSESESLLKEQLSSGGDVLLTARGDSMLPLLQNGVSKLRIRKAVFPLRKYQIILYKRANGQFVLHRVIGRKKGAYICRGDHQLAKEYPVTEEMVLGVLASFDNGCGEIDPMSLSLRMKASLHNKTAVPRVYGAAVWRKLHK